MDEIELYQTAMPTCDGLLVYCSDFRFWRVAFNYMIEDLAIPKFDILCYPGSAANLCRDLYQATQFLDRIKFLLNRHQFHTIVLVNHTDCGGYGDSYMFQNSESEKQVHIIDLLSAKSKLMSEFPGLALILLYISQTADAISVERIT
jgi:hypothetical protein